MHEPPSQSGAFIAKLGAWLQLAQFIGLVGTVIGMQKAFSTIKTSGAGDPEILSGAIGEVLISSAAGIAISFIGVLLVLFSITACRYRAVWMFWFLSLYGGLITFSYFFPFGLFFLIFALMKKDEFLRPSVPVPAA
ncbi:MotA/TolQ/ExbB proton channel family protein [Prosthecobacter sp.]|uniref:MotA/TolQ/ExbB proton channel family protein n=1 Tax=Prosthecobacter sp. TaxID=1965333 RepID=UPI0037840D0B